MGFHVYNHAIELDDLNDFNGFITNEGDCYHGTDANIVGENNDPWNDQASLDVTVDV